MRTLKTTTIVAALGLLLAVPLLAQVPEQEYPTETPPIEESQPLEQNEVEATAEELEAEAEELGSEIEAEAEEIEAEVDSELDSEYSLEEGMPKTASPLALTALLGLAGIGSATAVRYLRRK
jgi:nucleotide-binding universal stress UspA family protein